MTEEKRLDLALQNADSIGKAQARYTMAALLAAAYGFFAPDGPGPLLQLAPIVTGLSIMAWFGIARKGSEALGAIKRLIPGYNYGEYGGAVPFVWAVFYEPHNAKSAWRPFALISYPLAFSACLASAWLTALSFDPWYFSLWLAVPSWQVLSLWFNRLKSI